VFGDWHVERCVLNALPCNNTNCTSITTFEQSGEVLDKQCMQVARCFRSPDQRVRYEWNTTSTDLSWKNINFTVVPADDLTLTLVITDLVMQSLEKTKSQEYWKVFGAQAGAGLMVQLGLNAICPPCLVVPKMIALAAWLGSAAESFRLGEVIYSAGKQKKARF
jgi:hypothetical protein